MKYASLPEADCHVIDTVKYYWLSYTLDSILHYAKYYAGFYGIYEKFQYHP